jgi:heme/copper-type cytochrome/quinol oxidase subunit 2
MYQHAVFDVSVDSYMVSLTDLKFGELRLLEVDNPLYLPAHTKVRLDITASDVIHSFAVPSLGVKVDAIPGRINVAYLEIIRCGIYFGQCSELCGVNHGFMPLKVIVTDSDIFLFNVMTHFNTLYS